MNVLNEIEKYYDFETDKIEKNMDSTDGNVYHVFTKTDQYIAKLYSDEEHTKSMISLHHVLVKSGLHVPKIIQNKFGEYDSVLSNGTHCVVYSFLNGKELGDVFKNLNADISAKIAREVKKIHQTTAGENLFNLKEVPFEIEEKFDRYSALHFDLTRCNIFYHDEWPEKIGFIDFDDAKYGPSVIDVAITISLLYFSKSRGVDYEGLNAFIDAYYDDVEVKKKEVPYLKKYAIKWIDYVMDHHEFDSSTTESFEIRKNLIESGPHF